jgi:hypothetical protein
LWNSEGKITFENSDNSKVDVVKYDERVKNKYYPIDSTDDAYDYLTSSTRTERELVDALTDLGFIKPKSRIVLPLDAYNARNDDRNTLEVAAYYKDDLQDVPITLNVTNSAGEEENDWNAKLETGTYSSNVTLQQSGSDYTDKYANPTYNNSKYKNGVSKVVYTGDNSKFKGTFELSGTTTADFATEGKIFGGIINLHDSAELIWRGGEKDPDNAPTIDLFGSSKLVFDLPTDEINNKFSVYGTI